MSGVGDCARLGALAACVAGVESNAHRATDELHARGASPATDAARANASTMTSLTLAEHRFRQFLSLTKPRVVSLIVFCAIIGMFLATPGLPPAGVVLAATVGIWLVAGAAAAINCLVEQKIDAVRVSLEQKIDTVRVSLDQKIDAVRESLEQKIDAVQSGLRLEIAALDQRLSQKMDGLRDLLQKDMELLRSAMTIRLGSIQVISLGLLFAALRLT